MALTVRSAAFEPGMSIPKQYTGDGDDVSPPLSWSGLPDSTAELALIADDPDAPTREPWVHWVLYKVPPTTTELPESVEKTERPSVPAGAMQGMNSWDKPGYGGPAPPRGHGTHHYRFRLYALDVALDVKPGLDKKALLTAMRGHVVAEGEIVGTYRR